MQLSWSGISKGGASLSMGPPAPEQVGPHTIREAQIAPETRTATKRADIPCLKERDDC
jgi:hypothetical protein